MFESLVTDQVQLDADRLHVVAGTDGVERDRPGAGADACRDEGVGAGRSQPALLGKGDGARQGPVQLGGGAAETIAGEEVLGSGRGGPGQRLDASAKRSSPIGLDEVDREPDLDGAAPARDPEPLDPPGVHEVVGAFHRMMRVAAGPVRDLDDVPVVGRGITRRDTGDEQRKEACRQAEAHPPPSRS